MNCACRAEGSPTAAVSVFSSREDVDTLMASVTAAIDAVQALAGEVDVLVNGNRALADACAVRMAGSLRGGREATHVRLWFIPLGDKAHTWNTYVHQLWPSAATSFFIDGYAVVEPSSLSLMHKLLAASSEALAASAVPSVGASAPRLKAEMLSRGGLHGNLYALRGQAMERIRERGFRLPLGLYRTDAVLGAAICFGLDPANHGWNRQRITVHPEATWRFEPLHWWRPSDLLSHARRSVRQEQGVLENLAVRRHFDERRLPCESLPRSALELIDDWMVTDSAKAAALMRRRPLARVALNQLRRRGDWSLASAPPVLVWRSHSQAEKGLATEE
ncbi:MAG TPA: hypothetical protein VJ673_02290 [Aromatoleum sp.]|uniref:hypothetical protein n=1 Tax=Aromatoleum sp. TaxID=2307007 RepID=UPI002B489E1E|nr:hypothetical protein [Aromatoleum sp.]HJV24480.1 hypothetical protein [Aromatoleum sp.]